jgi:cell division control protein 45
MAFQEAAQISGARTRHDKFEAGILEIRRDDLQDFLGAFLGTTW